jgi:hypothetical protein
VDNIEADIWLVDAFLQLFISKPERSLSFPVFADDMNIYRVVII